MKFCDDCGTVLVISADGLACPKCGKRYPADEVEIVRNERPTPEAVIFMESAGMDGQRVSQTCPECGFSEAYRTVLTTQGEHAGVKQDRSVERYRCVDCGHTWFEN